MHSILHREVFFLSGESLSIVTREYQARFKSIVENMSKEIFDAGDNNSVSESYICQMIPHHRAGVEMCKNLLRYTTFVPLQNIAQNMINIQINKIREMSSMFLCCKEAENSIQDWNEYCEKTDKIVNEMIEKMCLNQIHNNININFIHQMIHHHRGAVYMSRSALKYPVCNKLIPVINNINEVQTEEIKEMEELLKTNVY